MSYKNIQINKTTIREINTKYGVDLTPKVIQSKEGAYSSTRLSKQVQQQKDLRHKYKLKNGYNIFLYTEAANDTIISIEFRDHSKINHFRTLEIRKTTVKEIKEFMGKNWN